MLKISCQGEFHRIRLDLPAANRPEEAFSIIDAAVRGAVQLPAASLTYSYKDEDGDLCSLAPFTCSDFLNAGSGSMLRLEVQVHVQPVDLLPSAPPLKDSAVTGMLLQAVPAVTVPDRSIPSASAVPVVQGVAVPDNSIPIAQARLAQSIATARSEGIQAVPVQRNASPMQGYGQERQVPAQPTPPLQPNDVPHQVSSHISPRAQIHCSAQVGPGVVIEAGVVLHACCTVGSGAHIGSGSVIHACANVGRHARIGSNCALHGGSIVGARAQIGSRTEVHGAANIGENAKVGDRCIVHGGVCVGANSNVGNSSVLHGGVCVGDYAVIEDRCLLHGGSGVAAHSTLRARSVLHGGQQA